MLRRIVYCDESGLREQEVAEKMIISVHQPQYLPWLGYFDKIASSDAFVFLDNVQYKAREYQNRNKIRTSGGWIWLSVPVVSKGKARQIVSDAMIDNEFGWAKEHLMSLKTSYGRAEYFGKYFPFFEDLYSKKWDGLADLNVEIIRYLLKELSIDTPLHFESDLDIKSSKTDRIIDICAKLKADTYLSGAGGRVYMEEEKFDKAKVALLYQDYAHPVYRQQFMKTEKDFIPYMSIVDLLFNEGPSSARIVRTGSY